MSDKVDSVISNLAEKHKMAEEDVREVYESKLEQAKDADLKGDQAEERALKLTWNAFKRKDMSNASGVEGVILGCSERYDANDYSRTQAVEAYQDNPPKAISEGKVALAVPHDETSDIAGQGGVEVVGQKNGWSIVSFPGNEAILKYDFAEQGTAENDDANTAVESGWRVYPLDTRESFGNGDANPNYGTPTSKHDWKRRCFGLYFVGDSDEPEVGSLTLSGKKSHITPPLGQAVQFKARTNHGNDGFLYLNSTSETEITENPEMDDEMPEVKVLLEKYLADSLYELDELFTHLQESNGRETIVAVGDAVTLDMEPNSNGTLRMVLGQMSFAGGEIQENEATVWIPEFHDQFIDFAADSRVYIVGNARLQDAYDPEKGERTSEEKEISISASGLYADPASKVPREDASELGEEDLEFGSDDDEEEVTAELDGGSEW